MITSFDPASAAFLNGINLIQQRASRDQQQMTTGLRINTVADDPSHIPLLLQTRAQIDRVRQINTNINQVQGEVDTSETALQSAVTLVQRAQTLATQGQSGFNSADTRQQVATELDGVLQQLAGVANTSIGGKYVFAGDSDQTQPYSVDLTLANPISAYAGTASTRQVEAPDGSYFPTAKTAQEIFDSPTPSQNVFQAVTAARAALLNNDQAGINSALSNLTTAGTYLNQQLTFYGVTQNRVSDAQNSGATLVTQLQTELSTIQDADLTSVITDFTQAQTQQQAALASEAKLPRSSLFDYLG